MPSALIGSGRTQPTSTFLAPVGGSNPSSQGPALPRHARRLRQGQVLLKQTSPIVPEGTSLPVCRTQKQCPSAHQRLGQKPAAESIGPTYLIRAIASLASPSDGIRTGAPPTCLHQLMRLPPDVSVTGESQSSLGLNALLQAQRLSAKVSIDTFVQWINCLASWLNRDMRRGVARSAQWCG